MNKYIDPLIAQVVTAWYAHPPFSAFDWFLIVAWLAMMVWYLYTVHRIDVAEREWKRRRNERRGLDGDPDELTDRLRKDGAI